MSIFLINITLYAGSIDYYNISKLTSQAKQLPYIEDIKQKDKKFNEIQKKVSELNEETKEIIKPKLEKIYEKNREIEKARKQEELIGMAVKTNASIKEKMNFYNNESKKNYKY